MKIRTNIHAGQGLQLEPNQLAGLLQGAPVDQAQLSAALKIAGCNVDSNQLAFLLKMYGVNATQLNQALAALL
jgi:hypothetical protein